MKLFKNRTVLGILCILLSLLICFAVTPLYNASMAQKVDIVRVNKPIRAGEEITGAMVSVVSVGSFNLPAGVVKDKNKVVGAYATADLAAGDLILPSKISETLAAENAYLYNLDGTKQAMSITVKAFANGLSGKLQSGDIVSVIAPDYQGLGVTEIPAELNYVEVIAVTANTGFDANTGEADDSDEKVLPSTVTLLVKPAQSRVLAELEADGKLHLSLVYRGEKEAAKQFTDAQEAVLLELYPPAEQETDASDTESEGVTEEASPEKEEQAVKETS